MTKERLECAHCGKDFLPQHYTTHAASLIKLGIKVPTLEEARKRASAPGANAMAPPLSPTKPKQPPVNGKYEEEVKSNMRLQSLRADVPIRYIDCPHCSGVLVMGEENVDHVNDLRSFLKSMASAVQAPMVSTVYDSSTRGESEPHGTQEEPDSVIVD